MSKMSKENKDIDDLMEAAKDENRDDPSSGNGLFLLLALVFVVIVLLTAGKVSASPRYVPESATYAKFKKRDMPSNNDVCRRRFLLPFSYSKDKAQRDILKRRLLACLAHNNKHRKIQQRKIQQRRK